MARMSRVLSVAAIGFALTLGHAALASAQSPTLVTGRVLDKNGMPVSNASVTIDGTGYSALANTEGRYSLSVPATRTGPAIAVARHLGYRSVRQDVTLNGGTVTLDFSLTAQPAQLSEIVVTALSQQREKATIGTAQQTISTEQLGTQAPNIIAGMSGKIAGLQIQNSGNMGGSSRIVIRGAGSILGNNQPLFIVDGIPISNAGFSTASASGGRDYGSAISDINPDDIQTLTVLKGPNAAALYGSRASNGAVVITTKNARSLLRGTKVSLTTRLTADQMSVFPKYQNLYGQGFGGEFDYVDGQGSGVNDGADESWGPKLDGRTTGCVFGATPGVYDTTRPCNQFNGQGLPWVAHPDNVKNFFQMGHTISNNINASGSMENAGARLSLTKDETVGIVPNSSLSRLGGALSASTTIRERLTIGGNLQYQQTKGMNRPENGYTEGNPFMTFTWFGRQVDVDALENKFYNTNSPYGFADGSLFNWNDNYHRNPYWQYAKNPAPDSRDRVIAQINANYQFNNWLSGLVRAGADNYRQTNEQMFAKGNIDNASPSGNGGFTHTNNRAREANIEGILTARKTTDMVDLTVNFGGNSRRNDAYADAFNTNNILVEEIYNLSNSAIPPTITNSESHQAVNSTYGSAVATFKNVFTLEGTARNDWSSTLPKENSSYFYPSITGSLLVSDLMPGLTSSGILSYLKIRGSWARVGSDAGPYQLQTTYSGNANKFSGLAQFSLGDQSANSNLKPEQTTGREGGVEFGLFNDRVTVDATYYTKITRDQILPLTVSRASGFASSVINAGQMSNRGIEASVTARVMRLANGFEWTSGFNYLRNRNKVDALAPGLTNSVIASQWGAQIQAREGHPYGVLWGQYWLRDSASGKLLTSGGLPIGSGSANQKILGNVNPDWTGGWTNEMRYKRLTLTSLLDFRRGGQNFSIGNWWGQYAGILESTLKGREVDWDSPGLVVDGIDEDTGLPNTVVVTAEEYGHNVYPIPEAALYSTAFVKLREVRLGWDVPQRFYQRLSLSGVNLTFVGSNLMTWTKFPNYDPENASNAGNGGQGFDMGALPSTRNLGFHLTITP
jgi:TonB-linked SusC/RagA family outer membrane protein